MTDRAGVTCRRCGFANTDGDQFCGSCGAFLEWEGEVADGGASAVTPGPEEVGDEGLSGLVHPTMTAPVPLPITAPPAIVPPTVVPPTAPTAPDLAGALLRCPACGIANAGTRTFCQSCGTRLAESLRVTAATREQITAAVTATPRPRTVPVAGATAARTDPSGGGSRGIAGWLVVMAVLGIIVGVGFVAASVLLKSPGPATGATAAPSVLESNGPDGNPGGSAAPGASDAPADVPSAAPTAKVEDAKLELTGASASSVVGGLAKFAADRAIDGDRKTCWQEGAGTEKGQWIEVAFAASRVVAVDIVNGYGASTALYRGNHRPKVVRISVDGGKPLEVKLKDTAKVQRIQLGEIVGATKLRVTIVSVYPALKTAVSGTPFDDTAISEISVIGTAGG